MIQSVLAAPEDPPLYKINLPAVLRAFSGLPPGLRQHLGRRLSDRLIAIGSLDGAKAHHVLTALPNTPVSGRGRGISMLVRAQ